ncbi:MAG: endonuclease/exonuclease/phosphatase family protein [Muribaculaceae bacterium]|nr:endonuclease/exonuclease/phosphatase family protein [Muribaculaceae bacterium]
MKKILYLIAPALLIASCAQQKDEKPDTMVVATYNIRQANHSDSVAGNGWGQRVPYIADLIKFHGFDIFGTQEGFKFMLDDLQANLPGFEYIGVGRDNGSDEGEHAAIFYNTDKFDVLDHGDFWLSETPDSVSFGWDAVCRRICTWGKFRNKETGFTFVYFNLHMDHVGTVARAESAKLILDKIKQFPEPLPVMLSGDFNVDQNSESYKLLNESGVMKDAYETSEFVYANNGTFNNYKTQAFTDERIDHIFMSPEFKVKKYGVLTDTYRTENADSEKETSPNFPKEVSLSKWQARTPSDHFPVMLVVETQKPQ